MNQSKTLIVKDDYNEKNLKQLQLTGNWFIDAGILGFVNLMEEVYGWDFEELNCRVNENPENIYYGYFPFAYLFFHSKIRSNFKEIGGIKKTIRGLIEKKNTKKQELLIFKRSKYFDLEKPLKKDLNKIRKLEKNILEFDNKIENLNLQINELNSKLNNEQDVFSTQIEIDIDEILLNSNNMFMDVRDKIDDLILDFDLNLPQDHRNFFLYNPKKDVFLSFVYLYYLLRRDFDIIKLIRALKDQESFIEFISFCEDTDINHVVFVNTIEKMFYEKKRKSTIIDSCEKEFSLNTKNKEILRQKWYPKLQKEYGKKEDFNSYEVYPDSTTNPFLYSPTEFFNVGYTMPLTLDEISSGLELKFPVYLLLLSFGRSFQFFARRNILFYTNNLNISYLINKRIKTKVSRMGKKDSLFRITWSSIIDELIENKAKFSLENMYLIEFEGIENQKLKDVKYLGITKLGANIIIDDTIRDALNTNIQVSIGNSQWIWLLEEFINNKPLFPHILKHITLRIKKNTNQKLTRVLLYNLSIDAKIKSLSKERRGIFDQYSAEMEDVVLYIKESYKWMDMSSKVISKLFSQDHKDKIVHSLLSAIKRQNKHYFVNTILKAYFEESKKDVSSVKYLNNYIFSNIVQNEENWENYALAMLVGFL